MIETLTPLLLGLFFPSQYSRNVTPYEQVVQRVQSIQSENQNTSRIFSLGVSDQGLPIIVIQIGRSGPATLIVGTHHGNEYGSTAVAVAAAQHFAKYPLRDRTLYIIPVLNTSGYNARSRNERGPNNQSFDANRDYEGPCRSGVAHKLKSTRYLANFIEEKNIVASATLHTYMPGVLYPWGFSTRDTMTLDQSKYVELARMATKESGYGVGNSTEELYAADGTFEDFAYWRHGVWSLLFEMGLSHNPNEQNIQDMIRLNVPGLRRFLEESPENRSVRNQFTGRCDRNVRQRDKLE